MGIILSLVATGIYVVGGPDAFVESGTALSTAVGFYLGMGVAGGFLSGVLLPLIRWRLGAVAVGTVTAALVYAMGRGVLFGFDKWTFGEIFFMTLWAIFVGGWIALTNR